MLSLPLGRGKGHEEAFGNFLILDLGGGGIQVEYTLEMSAFLYCMLL